MSHLSLLIVLAAIGATAKAAAPPPGVEPAAVDFRVDNAVFLGEEKEPVCRSTTIFHTGVVYDCMKAPAETIVFEMSAGRFILLNLKARTRAQLSIGEVTTFTDRLQEDAAHKDTDPLIKYLAAPKFREQFDPASNTLTLDSPMVVYRITLATERDPSVAEQYHQFSDWYARLNALLSPGSLPPFGRLVANAALAQRNATAARVTLKLSPGGKWARVYPPLIRSEHQLIRSLTAADLERVEQARKQMADFRPISFAEYRKAKMRLIRNAGH